jgi:hypothetical protein
MAIVNKSERHNPNVNLFWHKWALSQLIGCLCFFDDDTVVVGRICISVIRQSCSPDGNGTLFILPFFIQSSIC